MSAPKPRMALLALLFALILAAAFSGPARADEPALTRRATELRDAPGDTGRSLASLPAQAPVTRSGERRGPWVQVRTASGATGWLHLFDLGPAAPAPVDAAAAIGGALRGVSSLLGGGRATQAGTTAGIRGLGAEDLARAQPNAAAVVRMESLRQTESSARGFASTASWRPVAVDPLPAPARVAPPAASDPAQAPQLP